MQDVLGEIIEWSKERPGWQRDALRRLFTTGEITAPDLEELLDLCKAAHGLGEHRAPTVLSNKHLAIKGGGDGPVSLVSVTHHRGVNALAPEQTVAFGPNLRSCTDQTQRGSRDIPASSSAHVGLDPLKRSSGMCLTDRRL